MLKIYKLLKNTTAEGPGNRFCIWVQGCSRHCEGCFAKDTWSFDCGEEYSVNLLFKLIKSEINKIEGVTFLGGEPFEQAKELSELAEKIKKTGLSIVCFTGYTINELKAINNVYTNKLLSNIDLLIEGAFEKDKFDISRPWVGSSNQKYIFLTSRYSENEIFSYKNKIEVRISKNGKLEINGMADFYNLNDKFYLQLGENIVK